MSLIRISPPSLCEIITWLLALTNAVTFTNPAALICVATTSASLAAPAVVTEIVFALSNANVAAFDSCKVNAYVPAVKLVVTLVPVIVVAPVAALV